MRTVAQIPENAPRIWFDIATVEEKYSEGKVLYSTADVKDAQWIQNPKATLEANVAGSLEFTVGPDSDLYSAIGLDHGTSYLYVIRHTSTNVHSYEYGDVLWRGRLYDVTIDSNNNKKAVYEGQLSELNDVIHPGFKWCPDPHPDEEDEEDDVIYGDASTFKGMFMRLVNYYNATKEGALSTINLATISYCTEIAKIYMADEAQDEMYKVFEIPESGIFDIISSEFIEKYGGGLTLFYSYNPEDDAIETYLKYINPYSSDNIASRSLEFGKSIIDIDRSTTTDDFATVLIPYGQSLEDVDKSWVYMSAIDGDDAHWKQYDITEASQIASDGITNSYKYNLTGGGNSGIRGYYLSNDKGINTPIPSGLTANYYVIFPCIPVKPEEKYFVTQYLYNSATVAKYIEDGMLPYAIFDKDWNMISNGQTVGKTTTNDETDGSEVVSYAPYYVEDYEITIPEEGAYLKVAAYRPEISNSTRKSFTLKKFNPHYRLDRETILLVDAMDTTVDDARIRKYAPPSGTFSAHITDTNPYYTDNYDRWVSLEKYRKMLRPDLISKYGMIEQIIDFEEAAWSSDRLAMLCKKQIAKYSPGYRVEVTAIDTAFIDTTGLLNPFNLLDSAKIVSEPHGFSESMNYTLPIKKIEIDMQDISSMRVYASNKDDETLSAYVSGRKSLPTNRSSGSVSGTVQSIAHSVIGDSFSDQ